MGPTLSLYIYIDERWRRFFGAAVRERRSVREDKILFLFSSLLSSIYVVSTVGIRWAKNESSSTRRGLRVSTKNTGFH